MLTPFQKAAFRTFGPLSRRQAQRHPRLSTVLAQAHMPQAAEVYLAYLDALAVVAAIEGALLFGIVALALPAAGIDVPPFAILLAVVAPVLFPALVFAIGLLVPEVRANERGALVDVALPGSLNYMASMAESGVTPDRIVASLGRQPVYGEAAEEARWIATDLRSLGRDLQGAIAHALPRTPSSKLADVWQGLSATIASGANLKGYLLAKAEQSHRDNASAQRRALDSLAVLAESFLVVAVCAPILLIILLTIMGSAGNGNSIRLVFWLLVLALIPGTQLTFALAVRSMRGKLG